MTTPNNGSGLPDGWPDAAEIERIANELFSAKPGETSTSTPNVSTPPAVPGGFGGTPANYTGVPEHAPAGNGSTPTQSAPAGGYPSPPQSQTGLPEHARNGHGSYLPPVSTPPAVPGPSNLPAGGFSNSPAELSLVPDQAPAGYGSGHTSYGRSHSHPSTDAFDQNRYLSQPHQQAHQTSGLPFEDEMHSAYTNIPLGSSAPPSVPGGIPFAGATLTAPFASIAPFASGAGQHLPFDMPGGFGLPFEDVPHNLSPESLLAPAEGSSVPMSIGSSSAAPISNTPSFYFLEYANANTGTIAPPVYDHRIPSTASHVSIPFDVFKVRRDFPILNERVNGRPLIWLDNAATTQKPQAVIDRLKYFYEHENSNIHRAAHELAARATNAYEEAREKVRGFLNAASPKEIVFVRGATEAINLVAQTWGRQNIRQGDEIIISWLEHHANIVPWQILANEKGAHLRVIPVDDDGQIQLEEFGKLLGPKTKLVSFTHVSNALGTVTPVRQMIEMARSAGARVLLDGAQSVSHMKVDVQSLNPDWFVFSGHKLFAPTGIGVLYGKEALLNDMPPWQGGGNMIKDVTFERTQYNNSPERFEAGTGNIADAVGLGAAIDYLNKIGMDFIHEYEHQLLLYATRALKDCPGLRFIGTAAEKAGVLSFVLDGFTTEEVGSALSKEGIALRSGHHCAQPILRRFGVESTVRPSLAFYNVCSDIDALAAAVNRLASSRSFTAPVNRIAN